VENAFVTRFYILVAVLSGPLLAGEYAVLKTGFRIHTDRHETDGGVVRLVSQAGTTELPADAIASFETEEYQPPPPAAPTPTAPPAAAVPVDPKQLVDQAAKLTDVPAALLHSLVRAESGYQVNAVSKKGAIGLMQLMPGTAASLNADPHNPAQNAYAGALYLRQLLIKYQGSNHQVSRALAAYNAGPGAVAKYHGVPPYAETRAYVNRVIDRYLKETEKPK
jgi:soluble lytic murein transglycosylase-like protein